MESLLDKFLLLLSGMILLMVSQDAFLLPVWTLLAAIIMAMWSAYFENKKILSVVFACYLVLCFLNPLQILFVPLFLYCCMENQMFWAIIIGFPVVVYHSRELSPGDVWILILTSCVAFLFEYKTRRTGQLKRELIRQRDNSMELNLVLVKNNQDLIEKQDYEVYLATLRERNRIAGEIHDNVGHILSRSLLQMGALLTIEKEGFVHGQLVGIKDTLNQAMTSIRESVHDLHDDSIDTKQAVIDAVKDMRKNYDVCLEYDMSEQIPRNIKYCFIFTVKEAMSNIITHSDGDKIRITVREHPGLYQLSIWDNGSVRDGKASSGNGIGLNNMRERVEALHGTFRIQRKNGFQIFISIQKTGGNICG